MIHLIRGSAEEGDYCRCEMELSEESLICSMAKWAPETKTTGFSCKETHDKIEPVTVCYGLNQGYMCSCVLMTPEKMAS